MKKQFVKRGCEAPSMTHAGSVGQDSCVHRVCQTWRVRCDEAGMLSSLAHSRQHYESYVFAARPWTEVPQGALIIWVALPRSTRHSSVYQSWSGGAQAARPLNRCFLSKKERAARPKFLEFTGWSPGRPPIPAAPHCTALSPSCEKKTKTIKKKTKGRNSGI